MSSSQGNSATSSVARRLTWGRKTFTRSWGNTAVFLRKQIWVWPIVAMIGLAVVGFWVRNAVESSIKEQLAQQLQTILNADVTALKLWLNTQEGNAAILARDPHLRGLILQQLEIANRPNMTAADLIQSDALAKMRATAQVWIDTRGYNGFGVNTPEGLTIASMVDDPIGKSDLIDQPFWHDRLQSGHAAVTLPFRSPLLTLDIDGRMRAGVPAMIAGAPLLDDEGNAVAHVLLRIDPEGEFTDILRVAQGGESEETYAFDREGVMISASRFDDELKRIGLLTDHEVSRSILTVSLRDPGVNMTQGERPSVQRANQPLTLMAQDATAGNSGVNVDGYNDYRGVPVIGAWTWLPEYNFGVATEVDMAEAYHALYILRRAFLVLYLLLALSAVAIFIFTLIVSQLNRKARRAALEAKQLGQYTLEEEIGAGGMGVVYRAHHSMLRRPTAVKLLDIEKTTADSIGRFEREVQLTSQLSHPNTIEIYDYGRTPEGIFYYAMEYLDGIDLEKLVQRHGALPEGRVIHILSQICGSLNEAHGVNLVHRDIKPANIVINRRAGMFDVVKLLDFGLVKAVDSRRAATLTAANTWTGTPLYLSPESIERPETVDARSDLYAVGAVGYYLLTGMPLFEGANVMEICMHQTKTPPVPPSSRMGKPVDSDLEAIILRCLAKTPDERPQSARELARALEQCQSVTSWSQIDAEAWWTRHQPVASDSDAGATMASDAEANTFIVNHDS